MQKSLSKNLVSTGWMNIHMDDNLFQAKLKYNLYRVDGKGNVHVDKNSSFSDVNKVKSKF